MKNNIINIVLKNAKRYVVLLIILSITISYLTMQIAMNIKYAIDGVLFNNYNDIPNYIIQLLNKNYVINLVIITLIIISLNLIHSILSYIRNRITTKLKLKININLKSTLYKHMLDLEYKSYNAYDKIEIMQRINEDAEVYAKFFNSQLNVILDIVFLSMFIINQCVILNISIVIYIFLTIIIMLLFSLWYFKRLNKGIERLVNKRKKLLGDTILNINNFKLIRMFNKQTQAKENYEKLNNDYNHESIKFIKLVLFYDIITEHITYLKGPIIYMLGGIAIINGTMTIGSLTALINLAGRIFNCIYIFGENLEIIDNFYVITKKINKFLRLKEENKKNDCFNLNGEIIFSNVCIYLDNKTILENINFLIKQGEKIAIIGENGCGKSVLAKTILGFYDYTGNIYINNHNIKRLNKEDIRKYVELILGGSYLFSGSIKENMVLNKQIDDNKIKTIAKYCNIENDIERFNNKYDTLIGEKGTKLSGGQKQRLGIARSLIQDRPIMILDEALNKLDNQTRKNILMNFKEKYKYKTIIYISNNLEIINFVDSIIYINQKTTIKATHEELLKRNINYKNLININKDVI